MIMTLGIQIDMNRCIRYDSEKFGAYRWNELIEVISGKMMSKHEEINQIQKNVEAELLSSGADVVGFADVSNVEIEHETELQNAISIGTAYDPALVRALDTEVDAFEKHLDDTKKHMEGLLEICAGHLRQNGYAVWIPPISKNLPGLMSDFSHKTAATKAGLGWVGKNALFVSPEFGCGFRLATVLTDAPLVTGPPVMESRCGKCTECVKVCPYGALKGKNWHPGIERDKLLDAFLCSRKREEYIPTLGYKHPCGLCIQACPVGKKRK